MVRLLPVLLLLLSGSGCCIVDCGPCGGEGGARMLPGYAPTSMQITPDDSRIVLGGLLFADQCESDPASATLHVIRTSDLVTESTMTVLNGTIAEEIVFAASNSSVAYTIATNTTPSLLKIELDPLSVTSVSLPGAPRAVVELTGSLIGVAIDDSGFDGFAVIDAVSGTLDTYALSGGPIAIDSDGSSMYVALSTAQTIAEVSLSSFLTQRTLVLTNAPSDIYLESGSTLYVAMPDASEVAKVDVPTGQISERQTVPNGPDRLAATGLSDVVFTYEKSSMPPAGSAAANHWLRFGTPTTAPQPIGPLFSDPIVASGPARAMVPSAPFPSSHEYLGVVDLQTGEISLQPLVGVSPTAAAVTSTGQLILGAARPWRTSDTELADVVVLIDQVDFTVQALAAIPLPE